MIAIEYNKENPAESSQLLKQCKKEGDLGLSIWHGFNPSEIAFFSEVGNQLRTKKPAKFK